MPKSFLAVHPTTNRVNNLTRALAQAAGLTGHLAEAVFGRDECSGVRLAADAMRAKLATVGLKVDVLLQARRGAKGDAR